MHRSWGAGVAEARGLLRQVWGRGCLRGRTVPRELMLQAASATTAPPPPSLKRTFVNVSDTHSCIHNFISLIMTFSPSVPAAARAVASSSARFQPVAAESRCPRGARCSLHAALAIVLLGSACHVSTAQGTWSTAQLSVARRGFAATSVGNVAIFAGGSAASNYSFTLFDGGFVLELYGRNDACLSRVFVVALWCVQDVADS
jgi:hypothetical protein